jgi:hypothetical protein
MSVERTLASIGSTHQFYLPGKEEGIRVQIGMKQSFDLLRLRLPKAGNE